MQRSLLLTLTCSLCLSLPAAGIAQDSAVARGLNWLKTQQQEDGSWQFPETMPDGDGEPDPLESTANHATGLVLLTYLGAGQTHRNGAYKEQVHQGLRFLIEQMKVEDDRGDLRGGGGMTAHAVAGLALCEAYAATHDKALLKPAQLAVRFTEHTQNKSGGWGQQPGEKDDMYVFAWQLFLLKTARHSHLEMSRETLKQLPNCVNQQRTENTEFYGRHKPGKDPQATAIGLIAQYHLGGKIEQRGVDDTLHWLTKRGPARHNIEELYFVHMLYFGVRGEAWSKFHAAARPQMLKWQVEEGRHAGSWYDDQDPTSQKHGRLGQTAMQLLVLETYYRHTIYLPREAFKHSEDGDDDFPL